MDIISKIGKTITNKTQDVVQGTKDLVEVARINSLIAEERRKIEGLYSQLGKSYYEQSLSGAADFAALNDLCREITDANQRIAEYNEQILQIKGVRQCPFCGAEVSSGAAFCSACGKNVSGQAEAQQASDQKAKFCPGCGSELAEGSVFCSNCGQKVE